MAVTSSTGGTGGDTDMGIPKSRTLGDLLDEMAELYPNDEVLIFGEERYTWQQFKNNTDELAKGLLRLGVKKGDKVGILMSNRPQWLFVDFACAKIGAILAAFSTWYKARELGYVLNHSDATVFILMDRFLNNDYASILNEICPELASSQPGKLNSRNFPMLRTVICFSDKRYPGAYTFQQVMELGKFEAERELRDRQLQVDPKDIANILYTSGTTAFPKGVQLAHFGLIENGFNIGERQHLSHADCLWLAVPLFFSLASANAIMAILTHGGAIAMQESFDPAEAMKIIEQEMCTCYYAMPNMTIAIAHHRDRGKHNLSSLRTGVTIGPPETIKLTAELGAAEICNVYGMTETYGNCCVADGRWPLELRMVSQGQPLPGQEIKIVDAETRQPLPPGQVGEICVRGYITPGYYKDLDLNAKSFDSEGYLLTGDLGMMDEENRMYYRGRIKDLIKTGGINVSPLEVEEFLHTHPKVKQAHVVGVPDPIKDEVVMAFIEVKAGEMVTDAEIVDYCKGQIASYKVPKFIRFVKDEELPRTATGKVQKTALRELAMKEAPPEEGPAT